MKQIEFRVLLIEDDEDDYVLVKSLLTELTSSKLQLDWVDTYEDGLDAICRGEHDIALLDYRLGEWNGIELLYEANEKGCRMPVILLTGQGGYDVDVEAMRAGAADYLVKGQISADLLERSIRYSIERKRTEYELRRYRDHLEELVEERTVLLNEKTDQLEIANKELHSEVAERRKAEEALRDSEEKYRILVESALDVIYNVAADGAISSLSPAFEALTGWSAEEWIGKDYSPLIHPDDLPVLKARFMRIIRGEVLPPVELRVLSKAGEYRLLEFKTVPQFKNGKVIAVVGTARDVTERRQAEEKVSEQKEFLTNVLESLTHPFYVFDANDYTIKMANSAAAPDGLPTNITCYELTHRRTRPCEGVEHSCPFQIIKQTKLPYTAEHVHYDLAGNPRHMEVHAYPILDSEGNVLQIIEYSLDITERKEMEAALQKAKDELEVRVRERTAELAQANEALRAEISERKRIEEALRLDESRLEALWELSQMSNASASDITSFALDQLVRLTKSKAGAIGFMNEEEMALTPDAWSTRIIDKSGVLNDSMYFPADRAGIWADAIREHKPVIVNDYCAPHPQKKGYPDGHVQIRRLMSIPVLDGDRAVAVAIVANKDEDYVASDIRQLTLLMDGMWKLIQRERAEKSLRESERLAAMGRALSSVAHDMKTPLIAIGGFTQIVHRHLEEGCSDRGKLDIVIKETRRLENMVKEMLDFSKPLELHRTIEDLNGVVRESLVVTESVAQERGVDVHAQLADGLPPICFDTMRFKQVIINLVMNAIQASSEGTVVRVSTQQKKGVLRIDVRDCGCGIPLDKRDDIFLPFFSTKKEGTGLGLPIVKKIVEAHRGHVRILDNPEGGVTFRVVIPLDDSSCRVDFTDLGENAEEKAA